MLQLPIKTALFRPPWRTIRSTSIDSKDLYYYRIDEDGLRRPWVSDPDADQTCPGTILHVLSEKFGAPLEYGTFHPSMQQFIDTLKRVGANPEFITRTKDPCFLFRFDVSSKKQRAYYVLTTLNHGQRIVTFTRCSHTTPEILENVRLVDETLYALIKMCNVPEVSTP